MLRPFGSEQGNFSLFILLVLLSASLFTLPQQNFWASGGAMMIWGAFGFWRLAVISFYEGRKSKLTSLPAKLMATLDDREHRLRIEGHTRLHHKDIQVWFALGCMYAVWTAINFLIPAHIQALTTMQLGLNEFWRDVGGQGPEVRLGGNRDALVRQVAFLFCAGVASFTVHSFSYNETFIRQAALILLPVFTVCSIILIMMGAQVTSLSLFDDLTWRGAGSGAANLLAAMMPDLKSGHSTLMQRGLEQGLIGVMVVYILYLLPAYGLVRYMVRSGRKLIGLLALAVLAALWFVDTMLMESGMVRGLLFMGSAFVALAWGHTAYLRPYWAVKIEREMAMEDGRS
jgi:hypothetical protein